MKERIESSELVRSTESAIYQSQSRQDQALVRPKVLILVPFKQMAYQVIEQIILLTNDGKWKGINKKKKFREEYGTEEEAFNDFFRIGIAFNARKHDAGRLTPRLYEQFYQSDIIVASPLALRMVTGLKSDDKANILEKSADTDFLANVEFLVLDQAEAFVFQNMDHLDELLEALNKKPKKLTQINDITRLKEIYSHSLPKQQQSYCSLFRQTIVISKFRNLDLDASLA